MKINDVIYELEKIRNEHGNVNVLLWNLATMTNVPIRNIYYCTEDKDINKKNTVIIL